MDAGGRRGDGCAPGWEGYWRSTCTTTVKGSRYGHRTCDEHRRDRRACIRTRSVTFLAMGRRCVIAFFLLLAFSSAWLLLIGFRPCVLASLW